MCLKSSDTTKEKGKKKEKKADPHTADVEKGFSAQSLISACWRIKLTKENQDMLLEGADGSINGNEASVRVGDEGDG